VIKKACINRKGDSAVRKYFTDSNSTDSFTGYCASNEKKRVRHVPQQETESSADKVQLEIDTKTLHRLVAGQQLFIEDLHCLNPGSHRRIRRLLMDYLMGRQ
jgi:hypothetical protein